MTYRRGILLAGIAVAALTTGSGLLLGRDTTPKPRPVKPPAPDAIEQGIKKGIAFLLRRQNPNGSWGSARNTKSLNIFAPVPGAHHAFRAGTTGLCLAALLELEDRYPEVTPAIDRAEVWMMAEHMPRLRRADPEAMYNVWGHAYGIQALVRMLKRRPDDTGRNHGIRELIRQQIDLLARYECVDGGWAYYDFNAHTRKPSGSTPCFVTATVLVAFDEAKACGFTIPEPLIRRGVASMHRQRKPDFSYTYADPHRFRPMRPINRPAGSLGRSQACNIALRRWGDKKVTDQVLTVWLDRLFARNGWLGIGRKRPVPHESWFQVAGYFYYYGHYYAALCIDELEAKARPPHQAQLAYVLLSLQEKDGAWWDYPLYDYDHQYGTGFALMALRRCR